MQTTYSILILTIFSFILSIEANAQKQEEVSIKKMIELSPKDSTRGANTAGLPKPFFSNIFMQHSLVPNNTLPPDYYTTCFGFFCKKELAIEKTTKIPLRFRLGSLNYCNQMESKEK
ncbi:MAG: hypothetical protein QM768_13460 [Agriterribacter sp.]